jgi:putative component of membrane protein insertase Oxa1/YidC/SpoIIIJ protein YidD
MATTKTTIMRFKNTLPVILLLCFSIPAFCQDDSQSERLKNQFKPKEKTNYSEYLKKSTNEFEGTAALLFVGYKSLFSSQDMASCVFTPSCSMYAIESLQHDPLFVSYLKIFDRLSRCHPLTARNQYPLHPKTGMLYDPVY